MNLMPHQFEAFNGDFIICSEFRNLKHIYNLNTAIETGSCFYSTTKWLGLVFEKVYTVESNAEYANYGRTWSVDPLQGLNNVTADIDDSVRWLHKRINHTLQPTDRCIFYLDAHWEQSCPLLQELDAISNIKTIEPPIIAIHDFYTGNPELGYDTYNGQRFDWEWIRPSIENIEKALGTTYNHFYNQFALGAKRGIIYIIPKLQQYVSFMGQSITPITTF